MKIEKTKSNRIFFTADTHFGHTNIIKYCNRPYKSTKEHDKALIQNWNSIVSKNDHIFHLGDLAFLKTSNEFIDLINQLHGKIYYIWGNHDKNLIKYRMKIMNEVGNKFIPLGTYHVLKYQNERIILMHYAMRVWDRSHHGSWHLYGHSHGTLPDDPHARSFDVGVDCHGYFPIEFEQVREIMDKKLWQPIDHHGAHEEAGVDEVDRLLSKNSIKEEVPEPCPNCGGSLFDCNGCIF